MELQDYFMIADICNESNKNCTNKDYVLNHKFSKQADDLEITANVFGQSTITKIIHYCDARRLHWFIKPEENKVKLVIF